MLDLGTLQLKIKVDMDDAKRQLDKMSDEVEDFADDVEDSADNIGSSLEDAFADAEEAIQKTLDNIENDFGNMAQDIEEDAEYVGDDIASSFEEASEDAEAAFEDLGDEFEGIFDDLADSAEDGMQDCVDVIDDGVEEITDDLDDVKDAEDNIGSGLGDLGKSFTAIFGAGGTIVAALAAGNVVAVLSEISGIVGEMLEEQKEYIDGIQEMYSGIVAATLLTGDRLDELGQISKTIAENVPISVDKIGELVATTYTAMSYLNDTDLETVSAAFAAFADVTGVDCTAAMNGVVDSMKSFQIQSMDSATDTEFLVSAANKLTIANAALRDESIPTLNNELRRNGDTFNALGMTYEESIALLVTLANSNMTLGESSKVLQGIQTELVAVLGTDAPAAFDSMMAAIQNADSVEQALNTTIEGTDIKVSDLSARYGQDFVVAIRNGSEEYSNLLGQLEQSNGALADAYSATITDVEAQDMLTQSYNNQFEGKGELMIQQSKAEGTFKMEREGIKKTSQEYVNNKTKIDENKKSHSLLADGIALAWSNIHNSIETEGNNVNGIIDGLIATAQSYATAWSNVATQVHQAAASASQAIANAANANGRVNGSHRTGLAEVPYDGYMAELHKGEMILTAPEVNHLENFGRSMGDTNYLTVNNYSPKALDEATAARYFRQSQRKLSLGF